MTQMRHSYINREIDRRNRCVYDGEAGRVLFSMMEVMALKLTMALRVLETTF